MIDIDAFTKQEFLVPPRSYYNPKYDELSKYLGATVIDRTHTLLDCGYPNIIIKDEIPQTVVNPGDFSSVMDARAQELIAESVRLDKPIAVMYSGGLDSTAVACAFLKHGATITVVGSASSIDENINFYQEVLLNNPRVTLKMDNPLVFLRDNSDSYLFATGECGAHIMGTINWAKYISRDMTDTSVISADETAEAMFKSTDFYVSIPDNPKKYLLQVLDKCPVPIKTNYDALWFSIFALKWQFVQYRFHMWVGKLCPNLHHFYMSEAFQHWSLYNDVHVKCPGFKWTNYKMPIREYIYAYFPNKEASLHMPKRASLMRTYGVVNVKGWFVAANPTRFNKLFFSPPKSYAITYEGGEE